MGIRVEPLRIPMRDGAHLQALMWRPEEPGRYPVVLERVGYELRTRCTGHGEFFAGNGYIFIGQSVRGLYGSEGAYELYRRDGEDGFDTVEWIAAQPWCTGKVGMIDGSYSGMTQWAAAVTRPPHLAALFVRQGPCNQHAATFRGGVMQLPFVAATLGHLLNDLLRSDLPEHSEARTAVLQAVADRQAFYRAPVATLKPFAGLPGIGQFLQWLEHREYGPFWTALDPSHLYGQVDVPVMHLCSWYDCFQGMSLQQFTDLRRGRRADHQRLLVGPWIHGPGNVGLSRAGEVDFGSAAQWGDLQQLRLRWFDHWLKGQQNGVMESRPVQVFVSGENRWRELPDWPPSRSGAQPLYLRAGGRLSPDAPDVDEAPAYAVHDPAEPIPSLTAGLDLGPRDYNRSEGRFLTYHSEPLKSDLTLMGPVTAVIHGASTAPDTDWVVRLCDVHPDGRSLSVCDGILRSSFRDGPERQVLIDPGQVYPFRVELWATAHTFRAGHRIRVEVAHSDFPRYELNLEAARNTVHQDREHASRILLPVL